MGTIVNVARNRGTVTGACCRDTECTIETQESCESDGGVYQGDGTVCDPNPCECDPCVAHEGPLNPDCSECVAAVCASDPFCCETQWDETCASETADFCFPDPCAPCGFRDCGVTGYFLRRVTVYEWTASNPSATCGDCSTSGTYTTTEQYNSDCSILTTTCEGTSDIDCGELDFSCSWDEVDGVCVAEPDTDCPHDPNGLFLACAHTCDPINDCSGDVFTQTCDAGEGTGTFTVTQTVSDPWVMP